MPAWCPGQRWWRSLLREHGTKPVWRRNGTTKSMMRTWTWNDDHAGRNRTSKTDYISRRESRPSFHCGSGKVQSGLLQDGELGTTPAGRSIRAQVFCTTTAGWHSRQLMGVVGQTRTDDDAGASWTYTMCGREGWRKVEEGLEVSTAACLWLVLEMRWCCREPGKAGMSSSRVIRKGRPEIPVVG